ncbi:acetoacetyl-synthetase [Moniliophthora roreri]|nr:acetoacetyl-synthetase [Moniliophthora roreri]
MLVEDRKHVLGVAAAADFGDHSGETLHEPSLSHRCHSNILTLARHSSQIRLFCSTHWIETQESVTGSDRVGCNLNHQPSQTLFSC